MKEQKNIDRIFQENLRDLEVFPPNRAWNAIERALPQSKKRRVIPLWVRISRAAAVLILLFSLGSIYFMPDSKLSRKVFSQGAEKLEDDDNNFQRTANTSEVNQETQKDVPVISINAKVSEEGVVADNGAPIESFDDVILDEQAVSPDASIALQGNLPVENSKYDFTSEERVSAEVIGTESRFTVATIFAPIYISSLGDGSGVDSQFRNNPTSGNSSYSYGVKFAYALNNKFTVQSGVNLINLGYKTGDVYFNEGIDALTLASISSSPILGRSVKGVNANDFDSGDLNQVFGYVEIPVEIKYSLTGGKVGVNIVGGFSTLLLNKDEVFIETDEFTRSLGSSNTLRSVNFSGNFGVDVDYLIRKNFYINISPMLKVQTSTFSKNAGSIQPYYLGVYTGLNYKF